MSHFLYLFTVAFLSGCSEGDDTVNGKSFFDICMLSPEVGLVDHRGSAGEICVFAELYRFDLYKHHIRVSPSPGTHYFLFFYSDCPKDTCVMVLPRALMWISLLISQASISSSSETSAQIMLWWGGRAGELNQNYNERLSHLGSNSC